MKCERRDLSNSLLSTPIQGPHPMARRPRHGDLPGRSPTTTAGGRSDTAIQLPTLPCFDIATAIGCLPQTRPAAGVLMSTRIHQLPADTKHLYIHEKMILIDRTVLIIGSQNLSTASLLETASYPCCPTPRPPSRSSTPLQALSTTITAWPPHRIGGQQYMKTVVADVGSAADELPMRA